MRFLLFPVGSYGDVHPYVGLGLELTRRGHEVIVVTSEHFRSLVTRVGLKFEAIDTQQEFEATIAHPDLFHPLRGFGTLARKVILPWQRRQWEWIERYHLPGETVTASSCLALGPPAAREALGIPWVSIHLQPALFWSDIDPPRLALGAPLGRRWPRWWNRALFAVACRIVADRVLLEELNAFRAERHLPPVASSIELWHSPDKVLGLFPSWLAPFQADWPGETVLTGFPLWDESLDTRLPPEVEQFLVAGERPIAFTPGSGMLNGEAFFEVATQACRLAGKRGILLTRFPEQLPKDLPPGVIHVAYAPFSQLLPHCAALVYHGGIGTLSQACRAAIPQLIMPMSHDQPDNAARVRRLGIGDWLSPRRFTPRRVAEKLTQLTSSSQVRQACQEIASHTSFQASGLKRAADEMEAVATAQGSS